MDKNKFYEQYVSGHTSHLYGAATLRSIRAQFPAFEKYFGKLLPQSKDARILDAGCGYGDFVYWLRGKGYKHAVGVDLSEEQIARGKRLGIEGIRTGDILEILGEEQNAYDAIVALDVLEHFSKEELVRLLTHIHGALKPGGVLIAQTVNAENLLWGRLRHSDFTHDLAFTAGSTAQVLRLAGFGEVRILPQRPVVHGIKSFVRYVLWRIVEAGLAFYLAVETGSPRGIFTQNLIVRAEK